MGRVCIADAMASCRFGKSGAFKRLRPARLPLSWIQVMEAFVSRDD